MITTSESNDLVPLSILPCSSVLRKLTSQNGNALDFNGKKRDLSPFQVVTLLAQRQTTLAVGARTSCVTMVYTDLISALV